MKTKEKLELLWKYLLLLVLAVGVFRFTSNDYKDHDVMLFGDEDLAMDIEAVSYTHLTLPTICSV